MDETDRSTYHDGPRYHGYPEPSPPPLAWCQECSLEDWDTGLEGDACPRCVDPKPHLVRWAPDEREEEFACHYDARTAVLARYPKAHGEWLPAGERWVYREEHGGDVWDGWVATISLAPAPAPTIAVPIALAEAVLALHDHEALLPCVTCTAHQRLRDLIDDGRGVAS